MWRLLGDSRLGILASATVPFLAATLILALAAAVVLAPAFALSARAVLATDHEQSQRNGEQPGVHTRGKRK